MSALLLLHYERGQSHEVPQRRCSIYFAGLGAGQIRGPGAVRASHAGGPWKAPRAVSLITQRGACPPGWPARFQAKDRRDGRGLSDSHVSLRAETPWPRCLARLDLNDHLPAHFFGKENHRIGLAAALRVPEHAEPPEVTSWAKGGRNNFHNLQLLTPTCNLAKGSKCDVDDVIFAMEDQLMTLLPPEIIALATTNQR